MSEDAGYRDPKPWRLPVVVPDELVDERLVYRSEHGIAVWATLTFNGAEPDRVVEGFAVAWTREYVLVQTLWQQSYFLGTRKFWLNAGPGETPRHHPQPPRPQPRTAGVRTASARLAAQVVVLALLVVQTAIH